MKLHMHKLRHNFAAPLDLDRAESGVFPKGHVWMPSSDITVMAQVISAGGEVEFSDGNLEMPPHFAEMDADQTVLGMSLIGPPYIPEALKLIENIDRLRDASGQALRIVLGGQVVSGLKPSEFQVLFGEERFGNVKVFDGNLQRGLGATVEGKVKGRRSGVLADLLGLNLEEFPIPEHTDLIPAYEIISDEYMRDYLSNEFSLYLAQGCKYSCDFCAADRTHMPRDGQKLVAGERYRDLNLIGEELRYLIHRAERIRGPEDGKIKHFKIYLSNLDLFQSPGKLREFTDLVLSLKEEFPDFGLSFRALATVKEFLKVDCGKSKSVEGDEGVQLIRDLRKAGLMSVGFGIDGVNEEVWKSINKRHNKLPDCFEAVRLAREFDIVPEVLMVIGHEADTPKTLNDAVDTLDRLCEEYGAVARPHVAKSVLPGNDAWLDAKNEQFVRKLLHNPELFKCLDYVALPTSLTHPDEVMRRDVEDAYRRMCAISSSTKAVHAFGEEALDDERLSEGERNARKTYREVCASLNLGAYDR